AGAEGLRRLGQGAAAAAAEGAAAGDRARTDAVPVRAGDRFRVARLRTVRRAVLRLLQPGVPRSPAVPTLHGPLGVLLALDRQEQPPVPPRLEPRLRHGRGRYQEPGDARPVLLHAVRRSEEHT